MITRIDRWTENDVTKFHQGIDRTNYIKFKLFHIKFEVEKIIKS
jgi:hypothetical protein